MLPLTGSSDLDSFVTACDALGGINSLAAAQIIADFKFDVDRTPILSLDPCSSAYCDYQKELYHLISGRELSQATTEMTDFDFDFHVAGTNPYTNITPATAATHLLRLLTLIRDTNPPYGGNILDMGAGWGLSSEICAYTGCHVTAVDINPKFVELIRRRSLRHGLPVTSVHSTFESYEASPETIDMVLFYECLHHAVAPWLVLRHIYPMLRKGGCVGLVNEPVNNTWWPAWGIRLDALSIYCIRKFGWFESGWSLQFLRRCLEEAGFYIEKASDDPRLGSLIIARKN